MTPPLPPHRFRVLMLTTDVVIDRRILHEAESLADVGAEVILLAGGGPPSHEVVGRIKVHRLSIPDAAPMRRGSALRERLGRAKAVSRLRAEWRAGNAGPVGRRARFWLRAGPKAAAVLAGKAPARLAHAALRVEYFARRRLGGMSDLEYAYFREGLFYRPDVVHAHDLPVLPSAARIKRALGVPLVYDMHESYPDQPRLSPAQRRWCLRTERRFVRAADAVVTVNDLLLEFIDKRYGLPKKAVVQNAVAAPGFDLKRRYDRFREDYPALAGKFLVLYQGWVAPERNLETAIRAMARVTAPDVVLLIMGYGEYARDLQALAESAGVRDRVVFVPPKGQDELLTYSASADVGLIPYPTGRDVNTHLVSPNKLYEFITARLPILTNRLPFVERLVRAEGFGVVADLDDEAAFARALDGLDRAALAACRERLAREGWRYGWAEEQKQLLKVYAGLPAPGAGPGP
jgi:glycosyltransferase involved in cell wall biosynthesis